MQSRADAAVIESAPYPGPGARSWALFLDVDGTLLDIAARPDLVDIPMGLVSLLHELHDLTGGALALISGRPLAALDTMFSWERFDAAGCDGAELRAGGKVHARARDRERLAAIIPPLSAAAARIPGARLEVKGYSAAFHYRGSAIAEDAACTLVAEAAAPALGETRLLPGKGVIELVPRDVGKGAAVARLMNARPYFGRIPVYAGDDIADEEAFAEVNGRGGFSIAVGTDRSTAAAFRMMRPAALRHWLKGLAHAMALTGAA